MPFPDRAFEASDRRRVLVESSDRCMAWALEATLRDAGWDVATCWGPAGTRGFRCPVLAGERCALADAADVIVQSFPEDHQERFPILEALRAAVPDKPICVIAGAVDEASSGR